MREIRPQPRPQSKHGLVSSSPQTSDLTWPWRIFLPFSASFLRPTWSGRHLLHCRASLLQFNKAMTTAASKNQQRTTDSHFRTMTPSSTLVPRIYLAVSPVPTASCITQRMRSCGLKTVWSNLYGTAWIGLSIWGTQSTHAWRARSAKFMTTSWTGCGIGVKKWWSSASLLYSLLRTTEIGQRSSANVMEQAQHWLHACAGL